MFFWKWTWDMRYLQMQTLLGERGGYFREVVVCALGIERDLFPHRR